MQIIPLSEGSFTIDQSKVFVPFNTQTEALQSRPVGSILVEIQPFVVVTKKDIIYENFHHFYRVMMNP